MDWLKLILLGTIAGGLSGLFGIGGGVLLVPMLVYVMDFGQKKAQGTSLGVLSIPVVIFAFLRYYQKPQYDVRLLDIAWIILGFIVGSVATASIVDYVPSLWLQRGFACLLLYVGVAFLFGEEQRSRAVLPAAVATAIAWVVSVIWRRRRPRPAPTTEDPEPDYHI